MGVDDCPPNEFAMCVPAIKYSRGMILRGWVINDELIHYPALRQILISDFSIRLKNRCVQCQRLDFFVLIDSMPFLNEKGEGYLKRGIQY